MGQQLIKTNTKTGPKQQKVLKTAKQINKIIEMNKMKEDEKQKIEDEKIRLEDEKKLFTLDEDIDRYIDFLSDRIIKDKGLYNVYVFSSNNSSIFMIQDTYTNLNYPRKIDYESIVNKNILESDITTQRFYDKMTELGYKITAKDNKYWNAQISSL